MWSLSSCETMWAWLGGLGQVSSPALELSDRPPVFSVVGARHQALSA